MTKPTLYIICGLPFSGKTYLSKKIAEQAAIERISYDELWQEMNNATGKDLGWEELSKLAHQRILNSLTHDKSVIYDTLNDTVHNREVLRNLAQSANANAVVIYCNTPAGIIQQRQHANNQSNERHSVSPSRFLESANRFETPTSKEKYLEYTPNQNVEEWIHKNMISKTTIP